MKRAILTLLLVLVCFVASAKKTYILAIGVADYPGTENDLILPTNDATAVYRLYKDYQDAEAILLTNSSATKANIIKQANALFAKAKSEDLVILYFSGHGYKGGFVAQDEYIPYEDIRAVFKKCKAERKIIFADACFSGKIREDQHAGEQGSYNKGDVMLFLSSRSNETSIENPRMRNGFFTACLVRCLKGAADVNNDRNITALELFTAVKDGVIELSGNQQHPVMWGNFNDNMVITSW